MIQRAIQLADVPLRELSPVKITIRRIGDQDHSRWVFRTARNSGSECLFFKIWNPTYLRRDNVLGAIRSGFYDDRTTSALDALVFHDDTCRGYVMRCGRLNRRLSPGFFELVKARTRETGYFHVQFSACHTMLCENRISLLDLEAVYPVADYPRMARYHSVFDHADYERYVAGLYAEAFPDQPVPPAALGAGDGRGSARSGHPASRLVRRVRSGWRELRVRVGSLRPRTELISR